MPLLPLFIKVQATENSKKTLGSMLGSLEVSRVEADKTKAMEAIKLSREMYEASKERLEKIREEKKQIVKETDELKLQIKADADEKLMYDTQISEMKKALERIKALAASDEAIQKVLKACRRAKLNEDFMEIPMQFSGTNRAYVLHKQLECLRNESLKNSKMLKKLSEQRKRDDRTAKQDTSNIKNRLSELTDSLASIEKETRAMRNRMSKIREKCTKSRAPLKDLTVQRTKRPRLTAFDDAIEHDTME